MFRLVFSDYFNKQVLKLSKNKPLRSQIQKAIGFLYSDMNHPSLQLHKLGGDNYWSVSVNKSIRIILRWGNDKLYLLRIGKHEEVY